MLILLEFDIIRVVSLFSCGAVIFRTRAAIIKLSYIFILRTVIKRRNVNYTDSSVFFQLIFFIIIYTPHECFHYYRINNKSSH